MGLVDEKYMLLTTFRKTGVPVATCVWLADVGNGEVGFWTSSDSGKIKRLRHTTRVTVQPCDGRGKTTAGSAAVETTARLVTGSELEDLRKRIVARYGFQTKITKAMFRVLMTLRRKHATYADIGVAVAVPESLK